VPSDCLRQFWTLLELQVWNAVTKSARNSLCEQIFYNFDMHYILKILLRRSDSLCDFNLFNSLMLGLLWRWGTGIILIFGQIQFLIIFDQ